MTPKQIVFIGGHLGYPMDKTPLGGGAMVGLQMARHWARMGKFKLTVLGAGPLTPAPGIDYHRILEADGLVDLSEFAYARFCREFEKASTAYLSEHRDALPPENTCVILNDISEGPNVAEVAAMGYPMVSIWHVDVVDFFNKMYLNNWIGPHHLTRLFDKLENLNLGWVVPDLLRLVFQKQHQIVRYSSRLIFPSKGMADTVKDCYPKTPEDHLRIIPWGGWSEDVSEEEVQKETLRLRAHYQIGPDTRVLITLSRISPEKGILLLLEALRLLELSSDKMPRDLCLFICGEPAFMRGQSYYRQVRAAAERLKRCRVFFPGYLSPKEKTAYFGLAELFISPSIHESYGLSIVEALQAGLPVLASDHSGVDEILAPSFSRVVPYDRQAGGIVSWFGRGGDIPERLADSLSSLLKDREELRKMGQAARAASVKMSFADSAQQLADIALDLLPK